MIMLNVCAVMPLSLATTPLTLHACMQLPSKPAEDWFDSFRDLVELMLMEMVDPVVTVRFKSVESEHVGDAGCLEIM